MKKDRKTKRDKNNEVVQIYPMMPTKYTAVERAKLRAFEHELLSKDLSINEDNEWENNMYGEINYLKCQLNSLLKGDAMRVKDDKTMSPEERKNKMKSIEAMKNYIDNYEKNIEFIQKAKEQAQRMEDDGR